MENNDLQGINNAPVEPVAPVAPVTPVEPVAPVAPVQPVAPVEPVAPVAPVQPVTPVEPVAPAAPVAPVAPVEPVAPVQPVAPVAPVQAAAGPVQPAAPVQPVAPMAPAQPAPVAPQEKKKGSKLPIILIIIVLLIAIGVGVFFLFRKNASKPKTIVDSSIGLLFDKSETFKKELQERFKFDYKKETIQNNGTFSINFNGSEGQYKDITQIGKLSLAYDSVISIPKKQMSFSLKYLENDKSILGGDVYYKENKIYFQSTDLINQVYYIALPEDIDFDKFLEENIKSITFDSYDKIIAKLEEYVKKSVKEEYLVQEKGDYKVDGQDIKGLKTSFDLTSARLIDMENDIIKSALEDDEFIKLIGELTDTPETTIREELEEVKKANENELKNATGDVIVTFNIYSNEMGKYLALEIIEDKETVLTSVDKDGVNTIKLTVEETPINLDFSGGIDFAPDKKEEEVNCIGGDETNCMTVGETAPKGEKVTYTLTLDSKNKVGTLTYKDQSIKITKTTNGYTFDAKFQGLTVSGEFTDEMKNKKEDLGLKTNITMGELKVNLEAKQSVEIVDKVKELDTSNAKDFNKVSDADAELIMVNLEKKINESPLLSGLFQMMEPTSQYDYDEDDWDF